MAQSADKPRPDYNALLSFVGCSHRLVSGPVLGRAEAAFPKSCTLYHFILVTKAMYSRSLCVIFVFFFEDMTLEGRGEEESSMTNILDVT